MSWISSSIGSQKSASLVIFGGQSGTSPQAPFVGDTWAWPMGTQAPIPPAWELLQTSVYKPTAGQPDARAVMAAAVPLPSDGLAGRPIFFGGFSGYNGGLDDQLHNDTWVWIAEHA